MNNPNEEILLTPSGHAIGDLVVADNTSVVPTLPESEMVDKRNISLEALAMEMTGSTDAAEAVAELYPGYMDAEKRKRALILSTTRDLPYDEVASMVGVPERTIARWAYDYGWDKLARQEANVVQAQSILQLAKFRAKHRMEVVEDQFKQANRLRNEAMNRLESGEASLKAVSEAWSAAAKIEHTLTGLSEAGTVAHINDDEDSKKTKESKQPLVAIITGGGLPPIKPHNV